MSVMLETSGLSRRFGATLAVDGADLAVKRGELVCLLGPSGCGKSTLLRMVSGLIESTAGTIRIDGADMTGVSANRRPTAMVFQSHALWTHMNVAKNVAFGLRVRGLPGAEIRQKVAAALALVGLTGYEERLPTQLSGGQAQRVALARCLVVEPKLLLMDEPFSALDAHLRQHLREELKHLQRRLGLTILFVTHDQEEAMEIAERIVVMNAGRLEQTGAPAELYQAPQTRFVAGFIGLMNLSPVQVRQGHLFWQGLSLAAPVADGDYTVAIRPEDLRILPRAGAPMQIDRVIDLGPVRRILGTAGDGAALKVQIETAGDAAHRALAAGDCIEVAPRRLHLYAGDQRAATLEPREMGEIAA